MESHRPIHTKKLTQYTNNRDNTYPLDWGHRDPYIQGNKTKDKDKATFKHHNNETNPRAQR